MTVIDDYLAEHATPAQRTELERIRSIVKQMVPDAEEVMSYAIPTLNYKGKHLVHFAAFKDHMSLFPTAGPTEAFKGKLKDYKVSKGTIQFTLEKPLPKTLIQEIIEYRLANM